MSLNPDLLRESFGLVAELEPALTTRFYSVLFARYPKLQPMFPASRRAQQASMLQQALVAVLDHIEDASWLSETLGALGARHVDYGVTDEMYDMVGECLLATLAEVAGDAWTPALAVAWTDAYGAISSLMKAGAARAAEPAGRTAPAASPV